jgi:hypothetical protein
MTDTEKPIAYAVRDWDGEYVHVELRESDAVEVATHWERDYAKSDEQKCTVVPLFARVEG